MQTSPAYPGEEAGRPVLPPIYRIFDNAPTRRHPSPPMTLPPLYDIDSNRKHRPERPDTWPQYPLPDPQGTAPKHYTVQSTYLPTLHEPYSDRRLSAQQTNGTLEALASHHSNYYSSRPPELSISSFTSIRDHYHGSSPSHYGFESNRGYDTSSYRRYEPDSHHDHSQTYSPSQRAYSSLSISNNRGSSQSSYDRDLSSNISKHKCHYCGKGFSRPSGLKIHITTHTGEKPYVCPEAGCRRSFSVRSNMRRHVRVVHHGELQASSERNGTSESGEDPSIEGSTD